MSVRGEDIGIQICGRHCEQMSPLASEGNGAGRPTLTPGVRLHTTTGASEGQKGRAEGERRVGSLNKWLLYEPSLTLLFPSLQLSSKNICLLRLTHPPLASVLASPWPILSIVVDVMTKNKQCEGVRPPFVWAGRSPSLLWRGRISQPLPPAHSSWQVREHEPLRPWRLRCEAESTDPLCFLAIKLRPLSFRFRYSLNDLSKKFQ